MDILVLFEELQANLYRGLERKRFILFVKVVFQGLTKLLLDEESPVILFIKVLSLDIFLLLEAGIYEILVEHHNTTFKHGFEHEITLAIGLGFLKDVL